VGQNTRTSKPTLLTLSLKFVAKDEGK
jgi:hypothetical protein